MVDSFLPIQFGINSFDGVWENVFYRRRGTTDACATAIVLLSQSSRAKNEKKTIFKFNNVPSYGPRQPTIKLWKEITALNRFRDNCDAADGRISISKALLTTHNVSMFFIHWAFTTSGSQASVDVRHSCIQYIFNGADTYFPGASRNLYNQNLAIRYWPVVDYSIR